MRKLRQESATNIYHVMMRGNNFENIFSTDTDRIYFIQKVEKYAKLQNVTLYAWCLMDNHFHILLYSSKKNMADFIKRLACSYVPYYNRKKSRCGHLFQGRYKSKPVEDMSYFLGVLRYIHNNPENAGICRHENYNWSSYKTYINQNKSKIPTIDTDKALNMLGTKQNFILFSKKADQNKYLRNKKPIFDNTAKKLIKNYMQKHKIKNLENCNNKSKAEFINEMLKLEINKNQLSRLTSMNLHFLYRPK